MPAARRSRASPAPVAAPGHDAPWIRAGSSCRATRSCWPPGAPGNAGGKQAQSREPQLLRRAAAHRRPRLPPALSFTFTRVFTAPPCLRSSPVACLACRRRRQAGGRPLAGSCFWKSLESQLATARSCLRLLFALAITNIYSLRSNSAATQTLTRFSLNFRSEKTELPKLGKKGALFFERILCLK